MLREEFERKLSDYVRGELSTAEALQIEAYLADHPEAVDDVEAVRTVLELSADIGATEPPAALFAAARANALQAIHAEERAAKTQRTGFWQRLPWPVYLSGLAAGLAGVVLGVLWQGTTSAWAEVVAEVRKLNSVRVEGWIRGEQGEQVPVKQWLKAPHSFRSEVGTGAARWAVVVNDAKMQTYADGVWYGKDLDAEKAWSIGALAEQLVLPENEELERGNYQIEHEDRGATVLFSIWQRSSLGRKTPADIRYEVEVDAQARLPNHSRVYLDVGQEDWELVSELSYLEYDAPLADELFAVAEDAVQPLPLSAAEANPFGMMLEPFVPWNRAFYMPLDGMDIIVHPPSDDRSKGSQSRASSTGGGITRCEFHRTPLAEIVRSLGEMPVEPRVEKVADQPYSMRVAYSHRLTPVERVQRLGRRFGFVAAVEERQGTKRRWIFTQDGSEFPTNPHRGGSGTNGYNYYATGRRLGPAIESMLTNAARNDLVEGYDFDLDEIELQWDGAADNPFERPVDIDVDFSEGWDVALDYLRAQFGVKMERVAEPVTYEVLVMRTE